MVALALIIALVVATAVADRDRPAQSVSIGEGDFAWPVRTLTDLVSYADEIAVVTVRSENVLPPGAHELTYREGLLGRTVTLDVERPIWSRPSAPRAPGSVTLVTWGWTLHEGTATPIVTSDSARFEVGGRYVAALAQVAGETGRREWAAYAVFPLRDATIGAAPAGASALWTEVGGQPLGDYAATLARTEPDPLAARYARLDPAERWEAASNERRIEFAFLTSGERYSAELPEGLAPGAEDDFGVVRSGPVQAIQFEPTEAFDLRLDRIRRLPPVPGGVRPTLYRTTARPTGPVLVWVLPSGTMWVVPRDAGQVGLLARRMIVSEIGGLPHVELLPPLRSGDPADPSQRAFHRLLDASCRFLDAGPGAADETRDADGLHIATVAAAGIAVECTGEEADADAVDARAEELAGSVTPVE